MKHIIIVIPTLRMGGAEKALISLLKALDPNKVAVDLFLFESGGILQKEVPTWVKIISADPIVRGMTLELRNYFCELLKLRKFAAVLARLKITLQARLGMQSFSWGAIKKFIPSVEGHYDVAIGFLEGFTDFFVIDKIVADKKIGWIHIDMTGRQSNSEEINYYKQFDVIATISEKCKEAFLKVFPEIEGKIEVIENIVLPEVVIKKSEEKLDIQWDTKGIQLVSVGRLDYQKGFDIGAKAAKILKRRGKNICWHIYGTGIMKNEIAQYIEENNLRDCYILEGLVDNPYPYMKKADIIVQPSRWEGKSLVLDEAKILGKAIVVTNYPSVTDQITNGITGIITDINPEAVAEGIEMLIQEKDLRCALENNCSRELNYSYQAIEHFYKMLGF